MASLYTISQVQEIKVEKTDKILGKGLQMPFAASNSGSRKLMFGTQLEHRLPLLHPDVAYIQTGYEKQFGEYSSSFVQAEENMTVIGVVPKFSWTPKHHYFVFAISEETKTIHVFERKEYKHITENYGYLFNNEKLDSMIPGTIVQKGDVIQKSMAFDEFNNRMDGRNLLTLYSACEETMEDAIIISESASKKLASPLVKKVNIIINDNDIPLNLYGTISDYKIFPDIGEESKNSILCGMRREKKEESLFSQSYARLRELSISDERYTVSGRVVDVDIYCNAPERLSEFVYNTQLKKYYDDKQRMSKEVVDAVQPYIAQGYKMEYDLQKLYSKCKGSLNGKQYFSERAFSNVVLEVTLIEEINVLRGDKMSNRYGGKGITSRVKPDCMMPRTRTGEVIDVILNMCGVYGRENAGQLFEITVSYICIRLLEFINMHVLSVDQCIDIYLKLLEIVCPSMVPYTNELFGKMTDDEAIRYISGICSSEKSMYLVIEPMSENMTIDKVQQLYSTFDWIKPETIYMPVEDSKGRIRYVKSRRPVVYGYQYIYRLKQYAEEKFSVTSLSATNIRDENSKSKSSNNYKALYSRTPIRFGDMETGNLIHLGAELVVQMLMLYSTSPNARRLVSDMLTGDPFNIDVKLDMDSKNRNVEILNVYLKTMGLRLVFKKIPKKLEHPFLIDPMWFDGDPHELVNGFQFLNKEEKFDLEKEVARLIKENNLKNGFEIYPMEFYTLDPDKDPNLPPDPYKEWLKQQDELKTQEAN